MSDDAMIEKALDGLGRLHEALHTVEQQREEIASLRAEVERLKTECRCHAICPVHDKPTPTPAAEPHRTPDPSGRG